MSGELARLDTLNAHARRFIGVVGFQGYILALDVLHRPDGYFENGSMADPIAPKQHWSPAEAYQYFRSELAVATATTARNALWLAEHAPHEAAHDVTAAFDDVVDEAYERSADILSRNPFINLLRPNPYHDERFLKIVLNLARRNEYTAPNLVDEHLETLLGGLMIHEFYSLAHNEQSS